MDLRRLRAGEWIAAISGTVLVVSLFLPWYGDGDDQSAWEALAVNDVVLAFVGLFGVALLVVTATQRTAALPLGLDALVTLFALIGVVLVLVRVAWLPGVAETREAGLWLALAGALGVVAGAWLAMADERLPKPARRDVEAMPAPRQ